MFGDVAELIERLDSGADYSISTVTVSSPDGHVYETYKSSTRQGRLHERRESLKDTRRGVERIAVSRSIGARSRTVTKERRNGTERTTDTVPALADQNRFDDDWAALAAVKPLPTLAPPTRLR